MAGVSAIITSSIMFCVVFFPVKMGEDETMSFSIFMTIFLSGRGEI